MAYVWKIIQNIQLFLFPAKQDNIFGPTLLFDMALGGGGCLIK